VVVKEANWMAKLIGLMLLMIGSAGFALAGLVAAGVPEIDPTAAAGALALLSGGLLVIRARRRK